MSLPSTANLVDVLRQYRLLEPSQLDEVARTLQQRFPDPRALTKELMQRGWLSAFQANHVLQGKAGELQLGSYILIERLGEGGMGQVFKARHPKMGRTVAIKLIRKDRLANPQAIRRFEHEIRAAAQVSHQNIVTAYDAAQVGDTHFFVMEYVEGIDLNKLVRESGPLPVEQACAYMRHAALGLQHAFERGLIHRDIKPSNLLFAIKEGVVKILDMGLAKLPPAPDVDTANPLTEPDAVIGTPDFAAPEQVRQPHLADIRSDLYSLGCTFYFLLTGRPPFPGSTVGEKLVKHQLDEAEPVEKINPEVPVGVADIIRRLMAKKPEERYQTPAELAAVLDAGLQTGKWPSAGAPSTFTIRGNRPRTGMKGVPPPPVAAYATSASDATLEGSIWTSSKTLPARRALGWLRKKGAERPRLRNGILAGLGGVFLLWVIWLCLPDWRAPLDRLNAKKISADDRAVAGQLDGLVAVIGDQRLRHWGKARYVAISADGKTVASVGATAPGDDSYLRLWDAASGRQLRQILQPTMVFGLGFSGNRRVSTGDGVGTLRFWDATSGTEQPAPAGRYLGSNGEWIATVPGQGKHIKLWQADTGQERISSPEHAGFIRAVSFSADGQLAASSDDNTIYFWEPATGKLSGSIIKGGHASLIYQLSLTPDGKYLASYEWQGAVKVWEVASRKEIAAFPGHYLVGASPDSKHVVMKAGRDNAVHLWDIANRKDRTILRHDEGFVGPVAFSRDGQWIATGSDIYNGTLRLWDAATGAHKLTFKGQVGPISHASFSADSKTLASASSDGYVKLWDVASGAEKLPASSRPDWVTSCRISRDGKTLALLLRSATVKLWDIAKREDRAVLAGHQGEIYAFGFSPDDLTLATASRDGTVKVWDVASGQLQTTLKHGPYAVFAVAFGPDGKTLAAADAMGMKVWDLVSGQTQASFAPPKNSSFTALALSPDGKTLAAGTEATLLLWNLADNSEISATPIVKESKIANLAFTRDGKTLAIRTLDGTVKLWDPAANKERGTVKPVGTWAFCPDSHSLAAAYGEEGQLRVWDLETGQPKAPLEGHKQRVDSLSYSADGQLLASAGADGKVIVWEPGSRKRKLQEWQLSGPVYQVVFARDNRHLATVNGNGTVYILRLTASR